MSIKIEKYLYLLTLCVFKAAIGASLIAIGWDIMSTPGNPYLNVALVTGLTFVPAAFAKPLFDRFLYKSEKVVMFTSFIMVGLISFFIPLIYTTNKLIVITSLLILWTLVFLIEVCTEKWFFTLSKQSSDDSRKFSSLSVTIIQFSTISGPFILKFIKDDSNLNSTYSLISFLYFTGAVISLFSKVSEGKTLAAPQVKETNNLMRKEKIIYVLAMGMIWPVVATSNMAFPVLGKMFYENSFNIAANLEIILGLSMGLAGILLPVVVHQFSEIKISFVSLLISTIAAVIYMFLYKNILGCAIATFFLGFNFSIQRIEIRALLCKKVNQYEASSLTSTANALGSPLVVLFVLLSTIEFQKSPLISVMNITMPLAFLIASLLLNKSIRLMSKREQ